MSSSPHPPAGHEGPLAEFTALRQEIESRASRQQNLFALHITTAGAVFSFALSAADRTALLLIIPLTSYLFCARYVMLHHGIQNIARYIRDDLSRRVPGGLLWETWHQGQARQPSLPFLRWVHPSFVTFPGVALLALAWTVPVVFSGWEEAAVAPQFGLVAMWLIGLAAMVWSFGLVLSTVRRWFRRQKSEA